MKFNDYLFQIGLRERQNIIIHSSFKGISASFPVSPDAVINSLKDIVTSNGSIIFPTFTYFFKKSAGDYEIFDREISKSKVGLLSETFRLSKGVIRTSSPTHSFALWGKIKNDIDETNSPESPLGKESVLEWLTHQQNSFVLILGTDFSSLSYGHYLEVAAKVPWFDFSPWDYLNVLPIGVSTNGEQKLKEIPGCAKGFVKFEKYLLDKNLINKQEYKSLSSYFINIQLLFNEGMKYFQTHYDKLLCPIGSCKACDSRRRKFL
ncbi:Aminoglycoside N3'-acetyltransferase [Ignavibacterium album JCM 16511]|uniref:Aminoglycoside N(3)-acetyltransferase n=1 Tax=Ignavibacterium album (strain DSM 19864 / JCM 16511 / NBRC 101810 / Mat9-16) TaxID=945713 RepID=I0AID3_IGNAJ|nr:AAC(3) family N-acetyltransferase [Ignavibacterium album]AFH48740.1 Aminoglycoside N3'-acetyltransferase [Ignavibacterium album JCM 16511]